MYELECTVRNRRITTSGDPVIICGNSDYTVQFDLDSEWDDIENISAQFWYLRDGLPVTETAPVTNGTCRIPVLRGTWEVLVGISGGNIRTAAPARILCIPCVTDLCGTEKQPVRDLYNEAMEAIADA